MEGRVSLISNALIDTSVDIQTNTIDLTLEHKHDADVLHKLSMILVVQNNKAINRNRKSDQVKLQLVVIHTNKHQEIWMVRQFVFIVRKYAQTKHSFVQYKCTFHLHNSFVKVF